jgi:hypothetical protein
MERQPTSVLRLASHFYQDSHEIYASMAEWKVATVNWALPPGPDREEAKAYLDALIAGPLSDAELKQFWSDAGSDYSSSNPRAMLRGIRAALDAPYVKPEI